MKLNNRSSNVSNPLSSRKERPEISEVEMMPEAEISRPSSYSNNKINIIMEQQQSYHQPGKLTAYKNSLD